MPYHPVSSTRRIQPDNQLGLRRAFGAPTSNGAHQMWPSHDIVITDILWCVALKGRVGVGGGGGVLRNGRAIELE